MPDVATAMTTAELLARLQRHYIKPGENLPGGIFVPEVSANGSWGAGRRCDALYVGFTSSSGRILVGHELKISRADWLHELDDREKADQWADQCHEWWLVVSDPTIVRDGELPAGWGLMAPGRSKTRLDILHKPDRRPREHQPSWDTVRAILARQDTLRAQAISNIRLKASDDARRDLNQRVESEVQARLAGRYPDADELRGRIKQIEEALGGQIDWDAHQRGYIRSGDWVGLDELKMIADAVRAAGTVKDAVEYLTSRYSNPTKHTRRALDDLDKALTQLRKAAG